MLKSEKNRGPDISEEHIAEVSLFPSLLEMEKESQFIQDALKSSAEEALAEVDFDLFAKQLESKIATEPAPIIVERPEEGLFATMKQFLFDNPRLSLGLCFSLTIAILVAIPLADQENSKQGDVIVEKVVKSKSTQVAVLRSKNQSTGKPMTVVVIEEDDESKDGNKKKEKTPVKPRTQTP